MLTLLFLLIFGASAFIIENQYVNEDGLKVFTVSSEIKNNNCSCSCNCFNDNLPLNKIEDPTPPIQNAPKQFIIKKLIRENDCNCACSCVPNDSSDENVEISTPHQYNDIKTGILNGLQTTLDQYWPSTSTIKYATDSSSDITEPTTAGYVTGPPQTNVWPNNPWSIPFTSTQTPFTLPTIQWSIPFTSTQTPFLSISKSTQEPRVNDESNISSTKQTLQESSFVPGLEISPGTIDASFTKTVSITSKMIDSLPSTEVSGDTNHLTAEFNDQAATTVSTDHQTTSPLNPQFKEKVRTLLEKLKLQLKKMKDESKSTMAPETEVELNKMGAGLKEILINNSINEVNDRKDLIRKLDSIRGMLDKIRGRTTLTSIQSVTLNPNTNTPNHATKEATTSQTINEIETATREDSQSTNDITSSMHPIVSGSKFLRRLHEKLMNLKSKLDEMRQKSNEIHSTSEVSRNFNQLNTQLANIKNSLSDNKKNEEFEVSMKKQMGEMLDQLKNRLRAMQNEHVMDENRTTKAILTNVTKFPSTKTSQTTEIDSESKTTISDLLSTQTSKILNVSSTQKPEIDSESKTLSSTQTTEIDSESTTLSSTQTTQIDSNGETFSSTQTNEIDSESTTFSSTRTTEIDSESTTLSSTQTTQLDSNKKETPQKTTIDQTEALSTTSTTQSGSAFIQQKEESIIDVSSTTSPITDSSLKNNTEESTISSTTEVTVESTRVSTNIRRKPVSDDGRRGLEISKLFLPSISHNLPKVDFTHDEDESFIDMGSKEDTKKSTDITITSIPSSSTIKEIQNNLTSQLISTKKEDTKKSTNITITSTTFPSTIKEVQNNLTSQLISTTTIATKKTTPDEDLIRRNFVARERTRLIDTIINSSTRLIGESIRATNPNNIPKPPINNGGGGISQDLLEAIQQLQTQRTQDTAQIPNKVQPSNSENWIRKSPPRNLNKIDQAETTNKVPSDSFGFTPASDTQLFSLINRLMKIQAPVTAPKLVTPSTQTMSDFIQKANIVKPVRVSVQPRPKPITRINTTEQLIHMELPLPKKVQIKLTTTRKPPKTIRVKGKQKNSEEFYIDYESVEPTLPPDTPIRTPKSKHFTSTPIPLNTDTSKSFSNDANPIAVTKEESNMPIEMSKITTDQSLQEQILLKRLDEARRLREKLEKTQLAENAADSGIHFKSERRHDIEAKLVKMAEAERRRRILLESQHLTTPKLHDNEVNMAPTAKSIEATRASSHCDSVLKFIQMYRVQEPRLWIRQNCERLQPLFPTSNCEQVELMLGACLTK